MCIIQCVDTHCRLSLSEYGVCIQFWYIFGWVYIYVVYNVHGVFAIYEIEKKTATHNTFHDYNMW